MHPSRASGPAAPRSLAAALTSLFALAACATGLPHHFTDPTFGFEVRTDFPPQHVQMLFEQELQQKIAALCALFEVTTLADLRICVHDHPNVTVGTDASATGWHDSGEIHLMARWEGVRIDLPKLGTKRTLGHELVHALHDRAQLTPPRWMEEGLCEVLSASPVDSSGQLVLMPDGERERGVRQLRAAGRWLTAPQLLALRGAYPDDKSLLAPMYAQATSLVWFLLADCQRPTRATIEALIAMSPGQLGERFAAWEAQLDVTPVAALLAPFATSTDVLLRDAVADELGSPTDDEIWWQVAETLLADAVPRVRSSMRVHALLRPDGNPTELVRFRRWRDGGDRNLRLAGLIALAQCGDDTAAVQFCRALDGSGDYEWWQPMLWLALIVPTENADRYPFPDNARSEREPTYLRDYGAALADNIERLRPRLAWDARTRQWRLR